jgi:integrase
MRLLTHAEAQLLIDAIPAQYRLLIRVLLATGVRWGEATALTVSDLDLAAGTGSIRISRAWRRGGDGEETTVLGPTKTRKSRRTIALADSIADQLRVHVAGLRPEDFVFVNRLGSPISHHNFWRTCWRPAIARAGPHLLRARPRPRGAVQQGGTCQQCRRPGTNREERLCDPVIRQGHGHGRSPISGLNRDPGGRSYLVILAW